MPEGIRNFFKGKRVFITGHTGFKGSWLSIWLREMGAEVTGYALEPRDTPSMYDICGLNKTVNSLIEDVRDLGTLREAFRKNQPEIVFHMAAQPLVRYSYREPVETYETNVMGTVNVLEACRHTPSVKAVIIVTSDKCYENREWVWGYRENDPMGGYDPYSSSKGCAELVTNAYLRSYFNPDDFESHGVLVASVRAGNVIGGGDWAEDRLVPDCMRALFEGKPIIVRYPDAVRPWQHVIEPLYGYLLLTMLLYQEGPRLCGAWNFGPDDGSVQPVSHLVENITGMWEEGACWEIDRGGPHEANVLRLDCSKAKLKLGWRPQWDLDAALKNTVQWYKAYREGSDMREVSSGQIKRYEEGVKETILPGTRDFHIEELK